MKRHMIYPIKTKIIFAMIVFGLKFLDRDYNPIGSMGEIRDAIFILTFIFFGDILWSIFIKR